MRLGSYRYQGIPRWASLASRSLILGIRSFLLRRDPLCRQEAATSPCIASLLRRPVDRSIGNTASQTPQNAITVGFVIRLRTFLPLTIQRLRNYDVNVLRKRITSLYIRIPIRPNG